MVLFSKGKCLVMNESGKKRISGVRTLDNCYGLVPDADIVCNSIRLGFRVLGFRGLGYLGTLLIFTPIPLYSQEVWSLNQFSRENN